MEELTVRNVLKYLSLFRRGDDAPGDCTIRLVALFSETIGARARVAAEQAGPIIPTTCFPL